MYRPDELAGAPAGGVRWKRSSPRSSATPVTSRSISPPCHQRRRAFVDAYLDTEPNDFGEEFRRQLFARTAGHPLFTVELLRTMQERGQLVQDAAGRWVVAALDWACSRRGSRA